VGIFAIGEHSQIRSFVDLRLCRAMPYCTHDMEMCQLETRQTSNVKRYLSESFDLRLLTFDS